MIACPTPRPYLVLRIKQRFVRRRSCWDARRGNATLTNSPPVIATASGKWLDVDLLASALTDVGDKECPGRTRADAVEAVAPRIAQAERPDFAERTDRCAVYKGIIGGNAIAHRIGVVNADIEAQHLAEKRERILRVIEGIVSATAVSQTNIQASIGPELEMPAVVVRIRLSDEALSAGPQQIETR